MCRGYRQPSDPVTRRTVSRPLELAPFEVRRHFWGRIILKAKLATVVLTAGRGSKAGATKITEHSPGEQNHPQRTYRKKKKKLNEKRSPSHYSGRGRSIVPAEWCRLPATVPVKSLVTHTGATSSGTMRSSAGSRYSAGISVWRKPAPQNGALLILQKYFKDVSCEFDEFRVDTHLCKLRCWCL